jgi:diaminohydroxyphosphoribosylaminopyrimidine deaminase/5-amino-6-(5-phosphoribosylamino)uracil reductase
VIANGSTTLGEGFHHLRGEAHAEVEALRDAAARGNAVAGATLYVSLEPCDHTGLTPPCSLSIVDARLARVVVGVLDPNPRTAGGGVARLRAAQIVVDVAEDAWAEQALETFATSIARRRPYVRVKLAASVDGYVAPRPGERHWLTGYEARAYVRDLRASHDAVLVGAGTVRIDDPELTVRPPYARRKPYRRVVACETAPVAPERAVFAQVAGYERTLVLAPAGSRGAFAPLEEIAEVVYVGDGAATELDLALALETLWAFDIASVLCEGGPTLAGRLFERGLVDRFDWLVAPTFLRGPQSVPVLGYGAAGTELRFDRVETLGADVLLSGVPLGGVRCSAV